jgi:DNA/RNA-binding domain of Phe-tRNA-synthetase-like protein
MTGPADAGRRLPQAADQVTGVADAGSGAPPAQPSGLRPGFVAPELSIEFPGLRLLWVHAPTRGGSSPPAVRRRLRSLSDRWRGAGVVSMRVKPVPHAFRAFFRQIGLDPDVQRIPSEQAAVSRLLHGEFRSVDLIGDACLIALIETGVPVWALDADAVDAAGLGIRTATVHDAAPGSASAPAPPGGSLVVADGSRAHAVLFEDPLPGRGAGPRTGRAVLFALGVDGVPDIHMEEALSIATELLRDPE